MTLFRQLLLGISLLFFAVLAGVQAVYVSNARNYLQQQLESHSQDAATALGLSLATVMPGGDRVLMETVVGPVFDRGYYQSIKVLSSKGDVLVDKELSPRPPDVPAWFASVVVLQAPTNESLISSGWRQLGRVIVTSHPNFAYQQLWRTSVDTLWVLLIVYVVALWIVRLFLRAVLSPLTQIRQAAQAISERNFVTVAAKPSAPELRELVGTINSMSGKIRDVIATEVSRAEAFRREAFHDPLSGLDNRLSFEQRFNEWLQAKSEIYSGALFLVELNNFKAFNQKHGFRRGDELIVHAARALAEVWNGRQAIRARLGGATFALAVENVDFEEAQRLAAAVCAHFELTLSEQGYSPEVGFACGGCHFGNIKPTQSALFSGADMGLIKAQNQGLNTWAMVRIGDDVRDEKGSQYWKTAISRALEDNRLALYTQPVLPIGGGAPLQHEIVGRLIDERGEPIAAGDFLPMAVRHNLVELLDRKVIEKLVRYLVDKPAPAAQYALNISARSIRNVAFVKWLSELLRSHHVVARRLVFETTEIGVVQDIETAKRFAQTIRGAGAQFAVDNFGLHREAFRYLQALFPNYIKPSRGFFEHLQQHRENQFFIASVVKIAQPLEIQVIAQAIEDTSVLSILRTLGVHGYQGYATGKPERLV